MVRAYVLIQTDSGKAADVANGIRAIGGVMSTEAVTGPYDVIVFVEADDVDALGQLGQLVVTAIQPVEGIVRTLTCPVINL